MGEGKPSGLNPSRPVPVNGETTLQRIYIPQKKKHLFSRKPSRALHRHIANLLCLCLITCHPTQGRARSAPYSDVPWRTAADAHARAHTPPDATHTRPDDAHTPPDVPPHAHTRSDVPWRTAADIHPRAYTPPRAHTPPDVTPHVHTRPDDTHTPVHVHTPPDVTIPNMDARTDAPVHGMDMRPDMPEAFQNAYRLLERDRAAGTYPSFHWGNITPLFTRGI